MTEKERRVRVIELGKGDKPTKIDTMSVEEFFEGIMGTKDGENTKHDNEL